MFQKPFVIEDGHVYYPKKPLHKQPLFWTTLAGGLLIVMLSFLLLGQSLLNELSYDEEYWSNLEDASPYGDISMYPEYQLGDKVLLEEEDLEVTVHSIDRDDSVELVEDAETAVVVKMTFANTADEAYYFDEYDIYLYDSYDYSYSVDYRTYDVNIPEKIEPGKSIDVTLVFGADDDDAYRINFLDGVWAEKVGVRA